MGDKPVYSTEFGDLRKKTDGGAEPDAAGAAGGTVRVSRERAGRGGKTVSVVTGLPLSDGELRELAKRIKRKFGTGGSVSDGSIVIQGDLVDPVIALLAGEGFPVKRSGG